jgi:hypothetical protein
MSRLFVPATGTPPRTGGPPSPAAQPRADKAPVSRPIGPRRPTGPDAPFGQRPGGSSWRPTAGAAVLGSLQPIVSPGCACAALRKAHLGMLPSAPRSDEVVPLASCILDAGTRRGMLGMVIPGPDGAPAVQAVEFLDHPAAARPTVLGLAANAGVPFAFPRAVQDAAVRVYRRALLDIRDRSRYRDWQAVPFVTVDDPATRTFEQALHVARQPDGTWAVSLAVVDGSLVFKEPLVAQEAERRGMALHMPCDPPLELGDAIPMVPPNIAIRLSFQPDQPRPALVLRVQVGAKGELLAPPEFVRAVIKSRARLTFDQVKHALSNPGEGEAAAHRASFEGLLELAAALRCGRAAPPPVAPNPADTLRVAADSQDIIEHVDHAADAVREANGELSLLFNAVASATLADTPGIWRTKAEPRQDEVERLRSRVQPLELDWPATETPADFARRLARSPDNAIQALALGWVQACGGRLEIKAAAAPHRDLGLEQYTQLTASYRRFADALMTTSLQLKLGLVKATEIPGYTIAPRDLGALAKRLQKTEGWHRSLQGKAQEHLVTVLLHRRQQTLGPARGQVMPRGVKLIDPSLSIRTSASEALPLGTRVTVHADPTTGLQVTPIDT